MPQNLLEPTQIVYSTRRTLGIIIKPNGDLIVRSPKKLAVARINEFISKKSDWIIKHRGKLMTMQESNPKIYFTHGDLIDFKGKKLTLELNQDQTKTVIYDPINNRIIVNPLLGNPKEIIFKWLLREAQTVFEEEMKYWSEVMSLKFTHLKLSSAKSRWGSCSGRNSISLNWRLILAPNEILTYVIIHELAHIKHKNHSKQFWDLVENYDSNWKNSRKFLKGVSGRLIDLYS